MADPGKEPEGPPSQLRHEGPKKKLRPPPVSQGLDDRPPPPPPPPSLTPHLNVRICHCYLRKIVVLLSQKWRFGRFCLQFTSLPRQRLPLGIARKIAIRIESAREGGGDPAHFTFSFSPASLRHKEASTEKRRSFVQGHLITKRQ